MPQGNQQNPLPPCQTFADDTAARAALWQQPSTALPKTSHCLRAKPRCGTKRARLKRSSLCCRGNSTLRRRTDAAHVASQHNPAEPQMTLYQGDGSQGNRRWDESSVGWLPFFEVCPDWLADLKVLVNDNSLAASYFTPGVGLRNVSPVSGVGGSA